MVISSHTTKNEEQFVRNAYELNWSTVSNMENKVVNISSRKKETAASEYSKMLVDRLRGIAPQQGTPETDADPSNPNNK